MIKNPLTKLGFFHTLGNISWKQPFPSNDEANKKQQRDTLQSEIGVDKASYKRGKRDTSDAL